MQKLHLGCGQSYLEGYINIDFPAASHSVQEESVADVYANILELRYPAGSIDEIRLHHVFEHFPRPVACALLACWFSWLKQDGILRLEVPDFGKTARVMISPLASFRKKAVAERHLFGSHEAKWAVHCEGYTSVTLKRMLQSFGFGTVKTKNNSWHGTYNFEIYSKKMVNDISKSQFEDKAAAYLRNFLLDDSENKLLQVWMKAYEEQVDRSWAHHG